MNLTSNRKHPLKETYSSTHYLQQARMTFEPYREMELIDEEGMTNNKRDTVVVCCFCGDCSCGCDMAAFAPIFLIVFVAAIPVIVSVYAGVTIYKKRKAYVKLCKQMGVKPKKFGW